MQGRERGVKDGGEKGKCLYWWRRCLGREQRENERKENTVNSVECGTCDGDDATTKEKSVHAKKEADSSLYTLC